MQTKLKPMPSSCIKIIHLFLRNHVVNQMNQMSYSIDILITILRSKELNSPGSSNSNISWERFIWPQLSILF